MSIKKQLFTSMSAKRFWSTLPAAGKPSTGPSSWWLCTTKPVWIRSYGTCRNRPTTSKLLSTTSTSISKQPRQNKNIDSTWSSLGLFFTRSNCSLSTISNFAPSIPKSGSTPFPWLLPSPPSGLPGRFARSYFCWVREFFTRTWLKSTQQELTHRFSRNYLNAKSS